MSKKLIIAGIVLMVLLVSAWLSLPRLVNTQTLASDITSGFKSVTGMTLEIQGDVNVQMNPLPEITFGPLFVRNAPNTASSYLLKVRSVTLRPSLMSLFQGSKMKLDAIDIHDADVELERSKDGRLNWEAPEVRSTDASYSLVALASLTGTAVSLNGGKVKFTDMQTAQASVYKDIRVFLNVPSSNQPIRFRLDFLNSDQPVSLTAELASATTFSNTGVGPAKIQGNSGKDHFAYNGDLGVSNGSLAARGAMELDSQDIVPWLALLLNDPTKYASNLTYKPLPLKIKADVTAEPEKIALTNAVLDSAAKGTGTLTITQGNHMDMSVKLESLDLETLLASSLLSLHTPGGQDKTNMPVMAVPSPSANPFSVSCAISINDTLYNQQHIKNANLNFDMSGTDLTISEAAAVLPGNARIMFTGIGKGGYQGLTLEGQIDIAGDNFADTVGLFKTKGIVLPTEDFKRFILRTNAVIAPTELRFSEMALRIENMGILGSVITRMGARTSVEAALRVGGFNLDRFLTLWGFDEWCKSLSKDNPAIKTGNVLSTWLNHLDYDLQLNTSLESYTMNGKVQPQTDFKMLASQGKLAFRDVNTSYNGSHIQGDVTLSVVEPLPRIMLDASVDAMDIDSFLGVQPPPSGDNALMHQQLDLHWMEMVNGVFHLKFGSLRWRGLQAAAVDMKGTLESHLLTIDPFAAQMLGGAVSAKINITGERIPSVSMVASAFNVDADKIAALFPPVSGISGKYNLSSSLATNGVDLTNWITNLDGKFGVGGRDVTIRGFNLAGIERAVAYVRTVADILDVVKRDFPGGETDFSDVTGEWVIENGVMKTSNIKLHNREADGSFTGEVDIPNLTLKSRTTFLLKTLDSPHPPSISIILSGALARPDKVMDTSSLEQYITNKNAEGSLGTNSGKH